MSASMSLLRFFLDIWVLFSHYSECDEHSEMVKQALPAAIYWLNLQVAPFNWTRYIPQVHAWIICVDAGSFVPEQSRELDPPRGH